jgi:hypothetical protein
VRKSQVGDMVTIVAGRNSGKIGRYVRDDLVQSGQDRLYPVVRLDDGTEVRVVTVAFANACPTCGSSDPATFQMVGCGFKCDDIGGWHAQQRSRGLAERLEEFDADREIGA